MPGRWKETMSDTPQKESQVLSLLTLTTVAFHLYQTRPVELVVMMIRNYHHMDALQVFSYLLQNQHSPAGCSLEMRQWGPDASRPWTVRVAMRVSARQPGAPGPGQGWHMWHRTYKRHASFRNVSQRPGCPRTLHGTKWQHWGHWIERSDFSLSKAMCFLAVVTAKEIILKKGTCVSPIHWV